MFTSSILTLFLAAAAIAAPTFTERDLNSTKWTSDHILKPDEVILYGQGRMEVVHEGVYQRLVAADGFSLETPDVDEDFLKKHHASNGTKRSLRPRSDCDDTNAIITDSTETFVDWDVQMSPVVIGTGDGIDVYVSSGYTVSNGITVSTSVDWTIIKDKLGLSVGIDYTRTWSTQTVINIKGSVEDGYSGVMVTKPLKTRRYGRQLNGCVGSQTEVGTWMADSYAEGSYSGISWVSGAITMCTKKEFPLSRCNGNGNFV